MKKDKRTKEYKQEHLFAGRVHDSFALRKELGRGYAAWQWNQDTNTFVVTHVTSNGRIQYFEIEFKATFLGEA